MKNRFRIIKNRSRGGRYHLVNKETGDRDSLETNNRERANELLTASNESHREPAFNLQKARIYLQSCATSSGRQFESSNAAASASGASARRKRQPESNDWSRMLITAVAAEALATTVANAQLNDSRLTLVWFSIKVFISPGRDRHGQFQTDVVRSRADEKLIFARCHDVLLFLRVPIVQARGGNFHRYLARFATLEMHAGETAECQPGLGRLDWRCRK